MTTLEVKLDLPESLAKEAWRAGLLTPCYRDAQNRAYHEPPRNLEP
jgi:hypothetical protein